MLYGQDNRQAVGHQYNSLHFKAEQFRHAPFWQQGSDR